MMKTLKCEYKTDLTPQDQGTLLKAMKYLERPPLDIRVLNFMVKPMEYGMKILPPKQQELINRAVIVSLETAHRISFAGIDPESISTPCLWKAKGVTTLSGVGASFLGVYGILVDLPVFMINLMRSIAQIARSQGENILDEQVRIECLSVLALGSTSSRDDPADSTHYGKRYALQKYIQRCQNHVESETTRKALRALAQQAANETSQKSAPYLVRFIDYIARIFGRELAKKAISAILTGINVATNAALSGAMARMLSRMPTSNVHHETPCNDKPRGIICAWPVHDQRG